MESSLVRRHLESLMGQPVGILAARYWYRGVVSGVDEEAVILTDPFAVSVTGAATAEEAREEEPIPSDVLIRLDFVELICQPTWALHGFVQQPDGSFARASG